MLLVAMTLLNIELNYQKNKEAKIMLSDNIKRIRKSKGLSQEELAIKLNVVKTDCIKMRMVYQFRFGYADYISR